MITSGNIDNFVAIPDDIAALYDIKNNCKYARHRIRDEVNRITYIHDRFLGITKHRLELYKQAVDSGTTHITKENMYYYFFL